jgi:hypothetical protein
LEDFAMSTASSLNVLSERVTQWRANRESPKSRIPKDLWNEAVRVALSEGPYATSKATGFNYECLKRRMNPGAQELIVAEAVTFVEFRLSASSASQERPHEGKVIVELRGLGGEGMRIEGDGRALDLVGLARALWRRES